MDKKQRKEFRRLLWQQHGDKYLEDKDAVEALYDADYEYVMDRTRRANWHPSLTWTDWKKKLSRVHNEIDLLFKQGIVTMSDYIAVNMNDLALINFELLRKLMLAGFNLKDAVKQLDSRHRLHDFQQEIMVDFAIRARQLANPLKASDIMAFENAAAGGKSTVFGWAKHSFIPPPSGYYLWDKTPHAMRGEPALISELKREKELLHSEGNKYELDVAQKYRLLYLDRMIDGTSYNLKHIDISMYPKYHLVLESYEMVTKAIVGIPNEQIRLTLNIWLPRQQKWVDANIAQIELRAVIAMANGQRAAMPTYDEFFEKTLHAVSVAYKIPSEELLKPIPDDLSNRRAAERNFYNTILGKIYEPKERKTDHRWDSACYVIRGANGPFNSPSIKLQFLDDLEADLPTLDEQAEKLGILRRGAILSRTIFNSSINKQPMQNTSTALPLTKEQKRARINEIETDLKSIAAHKKDIAATEKCTADSKRADGTNSRQVTLRVGSANQGGQFYDQGVTLWNSHSISAATYLKVYKIELDEQAQALTDELNKLIA